MSRFLVLVALVLAPAVAAVTPESSRFDTRSDHCYDIDVSVPSHDPDPGVFACVPESANVTIVPPLFQG